MAGGKEKCLDREPLCFRGAIIGLSNKLKNILSARFPHFEISVHLHASFGNPITSSTADGLQKCCGCRRGLRRGEQKYFHSLGQVHLDISQPIGLSKIKE